VFLSLLRNLAVLGKWHRGTELDEVGFRVAATIRLNGFELDRSAFVT
jgi:hypothetical protein